MADGRTVVGFDGSPAAWRALDWATVRVAARGGRLEIVQVVDRGLGETLMGRDADLIGPVEEELRLAERHVRALAPEAAVASRWVDGSPARALLAAAAGATLLVVGTDRRAGGGGARIGSLPLKLAASADCVVAVIPDSPRPERNAVVVGIDESSFARSALALAVTEATWLGAQVEAVHAWDVPETFGRALDAGQQVEPAFVAHELQVVADAVAEVPIARTAAITPIVVRHNPAAALIERGLGAVAVVVGTRGRGRFAASVLGSVSHDLLLNLPCPVLVTPKEYVFVAPDSPAEQRE
jgi:nucleotide-binding universal stress UspA family protein